VVGVVVLAGVGVVVLAGVAEVRAGVRPAQVGVPEAVIAGGAAPVAVPVAAPGVREVSSPEEDNT